MTARELINELEKMIESHPGVYDEVEVYIHVNLAPLGSYAVDKTWQTIDYLEEDEGHFAIFCS